MPGAAERNAALVARFRARNRISEGPAPPQSASAKAPLRVQCRRLSRYCAGAAQA